ncbi:hypothetical protein B7L70_10535 [Vulcanisaeta sp. EB80]|jgi:hypothetical protein|nr:MAG: hypothetical protein AT718_08635 [Vulcanisaeta sp. JCHS_4]KUO80732.1 MAG: hypothetical protein AT714_03860 [Vulcanisaeta sp. OSP_8]MCG2865869.1 hypothetical protein [Vulcanisaeta sp.]PLC64984.1 hypothetical protein B7L70_10535 [Vulcanisaeta sp. EB80]MCG2867764.1 hypothetical protein [Vulcanisaeta sp.]
MSPLKPAVHVYLMTQITNIYADFKKIEELVARGLWVAVKYARGTCVSFTPKKVLEYAEFNEAIPVVLTLVKHILKQLNDEGYLQMDSSRSIVRYRLCRDSRLWDLIKQSGGPEDVLKFIEEVIE